MILASTGGGLDLMPHWYSGNPSWFSITYSSSSSDWISLSGSVSLSTTAVFCAGVGEVGVEHAANWGCSVSIEHWWAFGLTSWFLLISSSSVPLQCISNVSPRSDCTRSYIPKWTNSANGTITSRESSGCAGKVFSHYATHFQVHIYCSCRLTLKVGVIFCGI